MENDLTFITGSDGSYSFTDLGPGTYFIMITDQSPLAAVEAQPGTTSDPDTYGGDAATNAFTDIFLAPGESGVNFDFRMDFVE